MSGKQICIVLDFNESGTLVDYNFIHEHDQEVLRPALEPTKGAPCPHCLLPVEIALYQALKVDTKPAAPEEPEEPFEDVFEAIEEEQPPCNKRRRKRRKKSEVPVVKIEEFSCEFCSQTYESQTHLDAHLIICKAKEKGDLKCELCDKTFALMSTLKVHVQRVHTEKSHTCHMCGTSFCRAIELEEHLIRHENPKPYECDLCSERYAVKNSLRDHMKTYHTMSFGGFFCRLCPNGKKYPTQHKLSEHHDRVHSGNDRYACSQCPRRFKYPESLRNHVQRTHTPPELMKWYPCDQCNFRGPTSKALEKHRMVHLDDTEKPYKCSYCPKGFGRRYEWNRHEMIHREEKPFQCGICGHMCRTNYLVQKHMRVHQEGRAYACSLCDKTYRDRDSFKKHVRFHKSQLDDTIEIEIPPHPPINPQIPLGTEVLPQEFYEEAKQQEEIIFEPKIETNVNVQQ